MAGEVEAFISEQEMSIIGITTTLKRTEDGFEFQGTAEQANGQSLAYGPVNVSEDEAGAAHKDVLDVFEMFQKEMLDHMGASTGRNKTEIVMRLFQPSHFLPKRTMT